ncbi:MAG: hemerythrin domain-containing protein [Pseudomonadota bacterium]
MLTETDGMLFKTEDDAAYPIRQSDMPDEFRILISQYPRNDWEGHPGFHQPTRNWLGAHLMFRRLTGIVRTDLESYLDRKRPLENTLVRLSHYGDALFRNLHGHHHFEDTSYFPELLAADPRFAGGLEILEKDHEVLDQVLHDFADGANDLIAGYEAKSAPDEKKIGHLHDLSRAIDKLLARHLSDEEELAVPIILHHRLRG